MSELSEEHNLLVSQQRAAEVAARSSYGRLIALLCRRGATLTAAEDAIGEALTRALERWPNHGIPDAPEAWILTTSKRILVDQARRQIVERKAYLELFPLIAQLEDTPVNNSDRRLELMMICAHPQIAAHSRAPLMLQIILGLTANQMSKAFVISPSTLGQRLARAKKLIGKNQLPFAFTDDKTERINDVLNAIYAAFSTGYDLIESAKDRRNGLTHEAIWLSQILAEKLPDIAEVHGLISLMLFTQARIDTRRTNDGRYLRLSDQDKQKWDWPMIELAEKHLKLAYSLHRPGRFQIEAAIQSQHMQIEPGQDPDWKGICTLYDALVAFAPSLAAWVGRAAALSRAENADEGLKALAHLSQDQIKSYQPYWAVKAHLLKSTGQSRKAKDAYTRAIGLCEDAAVRKFLIEQQSAKEICD